MAWTSYRTESEARRIDWTFADDMWRAGMDKSGVSWFDRNAAYAAGRLVGWDVFREKSYSLQTRMNQWLPLLDAGHDRG